MSAPTCTDEVVGVGAPHRDPALADAYVIFKGNRTSGDDHDARSLPPAFSDGGQRRVAPPGPGPGSDADAADRDGGVVFSGHDEGPEAGAVAQEPIDPCAGEQRPATCPCSKDGDCASSVCLAVGEEQSCVEPCAGTCPDGFECAEVDNGSDALSLCVPVRSRLCQPCRGDETCTAPGEDGPALCVDYGDGGSFCGGPCADDQPCPAGYSCEEVAGVAEGALARQCVRRGGSCDCNEMGSALALATSCRVRSDHGVCEGARRCEAGGLSACDAATPSAERCDGADNDCDGEIDEGFADLDGNGLTDCLEPDEDGDGVPDARDLCPDVEDPGQLDMDGDGEGDACDRDADGDGSYSDTDCDPFEPKVHPGALELCDGVDNDCDGVVDDTPECDDGIGCTVDTCRAVGGCLHSPADDLCDDGDACATEICDGVRGCVGVPASGGSCDDGDPCTVADTCSGGLCRGIAVSCDDSNPCTFDGCAGGGCTHEAAPDTLVCDDGDPCTVADTCSGGRCAGRPWSCDDGDPCTADSCVAGGCVHTAHDGPECSAGETLEAGVAAGGESTCALRPDGSVWCWGTGQAGQLGYDSARVNPSPRRVEGLPAARAISIGNAHACAIDADDALWCWGANDSDRLSTGFEGPVPHRVPGFEQTEKVSATWNNTCAIKKDGTLWCWGRNYEGQLTDPNAGFSSGPLRIAGISGVEKVLHGHVHICALAGDQVFCWGSNSHGQVLAGAEANARSPVRVPAASGATALALGLAHSCAALPGGRVICWGSDEHGVVSGAARLAGSLPAGVGVEHLASTSESVCAGLSDGTLRCWGGNRFGQVGDGGFADRSTPAPVPGVFAVTGLAAGFAHTCAQRDDGAVLCWGSDSLGQLGRGGRSESTPAPVEVLSVSGAVRVRNAVTSACALTSAGRLWCWGHGTFGQLGPSHGGTYGLPELLPHVSSLVALAGSYLSICAGDSSGRVRCWGNDFDTGPIFNGIEDLACGHAHVCVVDSAGAVRCWGNNGFGEVGDGTRTRREASNPALVMSGAAQVALGTSFTCARSAEGAVWCWGTNDQGQLGLGSTAEATTPSRVTGLVTVTDLAARRRHACAVAAFSGEVFCWGNNEGGKAGQPASTSSVPSPRRVVGVSGASRVSVGGNHTCALASGSVYCWGRNGSDQLGSRRADGPKPSLVEGLPAIVDVGAGESWSCGVTSAAKVYCWGANTNGELGDGGAFWPQPVKVVGLQ